MARDIVVGIVGDASKFNSATAGAITQTQTLTSKLQGVGKGLVIGAGIGAFNLLTGAISAGIGKLDEAREAYLADTASQALLAQALKNNIPNWDGNTEGVERYAAAQARLAFTDDEVRDSIGQLIGVTHDLEEAQKLNTLAQDLARAKNIELSVASDIVTKAYQGNGKALKGLGIDTSEAATAADLLAAIQQNASGAAETWAASQGKAAVSNVKVGEAMEKVGAIVDKVAQVALPILADALTFIVDTLGAVWDAIQPVVTILGDVLTPIIQALGPIVTTVFGVIGTVIGGAARTIVGVVNAIKSGVNAIIDGINGIIRGWNNISFQIPQIDLPGGGTIGGGSIGTPNIGYLPRLHTGGIVPGSPGSEQLAILQAGERVIPRNAAGTIVINIESFIGSDRDIDRFADRLAYRLNLTR